MIIKQIPVGAFQMNSYIVGCEETKEAIYIDPGAEVDRVIDTVKGLGFEFTQLIGTHAHLDHAGGLADFLARLEKDGLTPDDRYTMLSTHPPSAARAATVRAAATNGGPSMSDADWAAIKTICD